MTRDQAIKLVTAATFSAPDYPMAPFLVDALDGLGMLKLTEPKNVLKRAESALRVAIQVGSPDDPMDAMDIIGCLDDAGLRIVEK